MKTTTIEIPEGKRAEWVDGVLTLVDDKPVEFKFKVGDRVQILKDGTFQADNKDTVHLCKGSVATIMDIKDELCLLTYQGYHCKYNSKDLLSIEPKVEFKFKMGDKVCVKGDTSKYKVVANCVALRGKPFYTLSLIDKITLYPESDIEPYTEPKDITERIKTFEDACAWCTKNGHFELRREYDCIVTDTLILDEASKDLVAYLKLRIITCALNEGWEPKFCADETRYTPHYYTDPEEPISTAPNSWYSIGGASSAKLSFKSKKLAEYAAFQFKGIYMDFCYKGKE